MSVTRTLRGRLLACVLAAAGWACGEESGGPLSVASLAPQPDEDVLQLASSVPPELVPVDLAFEEPARPELAPGERLRRFLLRFHVALRRTWLVADRVGNEEALALVEDAHEQYRLALRLFRAHAPREALTHLRAAARLLAEARMLLREELAADEGEREGADQPTRR